MTLKHQITKARLLDSLSKSHRNQNACRYESRPGYQTVEKLETRCRKQQHINCCIRSYPISNTKWGRKPIFWSNLLEILKVT